MLIAFSHAEVAPLNLSSADYIQIYSGDKATLTESLEFVQQAAAKILAAINSASPQGEAPNILKFLSDTARLGESSRGRFASRAVWYDEADAAARRSRMVRTLNINADIPATRELDLHITLPADVPLGPAEIVLVVSSGSASKRSTAGDLLDSEFFGIWKSRTDIKDSVDFAQELRTQGWKRSA